MAGPGPRRSQGNERELSTQNSQSSLAVRLARASSLEPTCWGASPFGNLSQGDLETALRGLADPGEDSRQSGWQLSHYQRVTTTIFVNPRDLIRAQHRRHCAYVRVCLAAHRRRVPTYLLHAVLLFAAALQCHPCPLPWHAHPVDVADEQSSTKLQPQHDVLWDGLQVAQPARVPSPRSARSALGPAIDSWLGHVTKRGGEQAGEDP